MKCNLSQLHKHVVMHSAATYYFSNQTNVKGGIVHNNCIYAL